MNTGMISAVLGNCLTFIFPMTIPLCFLFVFQTVVISGMHSSTFIYFSLSDPSLYFLPSLPSIVASLALQYGMPFIFDHAVITISPCLVKHFDTTSWPEITFFTATIVLFILATSIDQDSTLA